MLEEVDKSGGSSIDSADLATLARAAYEQGRTKNCLALTQAMLMMNPQDAQARALQSTIQADLKKAVSNARALLEEAHLHDNLSSYKQAAEVLLLKVLHLDP